MSDLPPWVAARLHETVESSTEWPEAIALTPRARVAVTPRAVPGEPPIERRADWDALPPKSNPGPFASLEATVCHYTAAPEGYMVRPDEPHDWCREQMRSIQRQHQAIPEQSDFEYNAACCAHGTLFEGRVLGYKGGANGSAETNRTMPSICCLIGVDDQPNDPMLYAVAWFHGTVQAHAGRPLDMHRHGELYPTSCPGAILGAWVDAGGYRTMTPIPPPPVQEDHMAFLIAVTSHPGYDPATQVVYVADWLERRWVQNEEQLALMVRGGLAPPTLVDWADIDAYGVPVGPAP